MSLMSQPDEKPSEVFMRRLGMPKAVADALVASQVTTLEELAYIPLEDLLSVRSVEPWLLRELRDQARRQLIEGL